VRTALEPAADGSGLALNEVGLMSEMARKRGGLGGERSDN
jgi:hypothetical protein